MNVTILQAIVWASYFISLFFLVYWLLYFLEKKKDIKKESKKNIPKITQYPTVTITVPAYNAEKHVIKTLKSLIELEYDKSKLEIVVVNDGSRDNTKNIVEKFISQHKEDNIILINHKRNLGKADALNTSMSKSTAEFFSCIDSDSRVEKDALIYMIEQMQRDPKLAIATPVMKVENPKTWMQKFQRIEYMSSMLISRLMGHLDSMYVAPGPFSLYRMTALKKLGKFDGTHNIEDQEIAWRAQKKHLKMRQCPHAFVYTVAPRNIKQFTAQRTRWYRGSIMTIYDYKSMFLNKKYGDFGMIQIPLMIFSYILSFIAIIALGYYLIKPLLRKLYDFILIKFDLITYFSNAKININILDIEAMQVVMIYAALLIAVIMLYFASRTTNDRVRKYGSIYIILYFFVYYIIVSIIIIKSFFEILIRKKQKW
ncbi:MAG: glycosyltransferase [Candidatus Woesearchaeota archaeon]